MALDANYFEDQPLDVGLEPQLLIDDYLVEDRFKLTRVLRQPAKHADNPILVRDQPWEGRLAYRPCVLSDEEFGGYRMWYQCAGDYGPDGPSHHICYAESSDGYHWDKPLLRVCDFPGFDRTNVVYCGTHHPRVQGTQVFKDPEDPDPARRYKMICAERRRVGQAMYCGVHLVCSPDGLRWQLAGDKPILDFHSDCYNNVVFDPLRRRWLLFCRPKYMFAAGRELKEAQPYKRHMARRVAVMTSPDFEHWSYPRTVLYPDERDRPDYDSALVFRYGAQFIMLYAAMDGDGDGANEVRLASSRDGLHWRRHFSREPFLPRGPEGAWDAGQTTVGGAPVQRGDEMMFYYTGTAEPQLSKSRRSGGIGLALFKAGQFVEQRGDDPPGFLLTRELVLAGNRLRLNTAAPPAGLEGAVRAEIARRPELGAHKFFTQACEGFGVGDCDPITVGDANALVTWRGNPDLGALAGERVYLRFELRRMGLYAFQFCQE